MICSDRSYRYFVPVLALALLLGSACSRQRYEMPVTTNSQEAKKLFLQARKLYENLRENEARDMFLHALDHDLDFALCHLYLADLATSAIDLQTHLKLAVSLAPKTSEGEQLFIKSMRAVFENNRPQAIELAGKLVEMFPRDKRAHRWLGYLYRGRDEDKAIAAYKKAIEIDKNYAPAWNNLGYAYQRKGENENAIMAFKRYSKLLPNEANPHDSMAELYKKIGEYEKSIVEYKKALELNRAFTFSQRNIGENLIFLKNYDEARYMFNEILGLDTPRANKVNALQMVAHSYVYEGKFDEALAATDRAIKMAEESILPEWQGRLLLDKAFIYRETGRYDEAEAVLLACRKMITGSPLSAADKANFSQDILYARAGVAAQRGNSILALDLAEKLKAQIEAGNDPDEIVRYYDLLGYIYHVHGDDKLAVENYAKADPKNPYSLFMWGKCEARVGNGSRAQELFKKVANWNESSIEYAIVRNQAIAAQDADPLARK